MMMNSKVFSQTCNQIKQYGADVNKFLPAMDALVYAQWIWTIISVHCNIFPWEETWRTGSLCWKLTKTAPNMKLKKNGTLCFLKAIVANQTPHRQPLILSKTGKVDELGPTHKKIGVIDQRKATDCVDLLWATTQPIRTFQPSFITSLTWLPPVEDKIHRCPW